VDGCVHESEEEMVDSRKRGIEQPAGSAEQMEKWREFAELVEVDLGEGSHFGKTIVP
jgi:hypothetical protein